MGKTKTIKDPRGRSDMSSRLYMTYRNTRHFMALDGLRGIAVLMVLCVHSTDPLWAPLNGALGVSLFFVLSGYLITTLLLREKTETGSISLRKFYIRRIFRILPLYYVALAVFSILVLLFELGSRPNEYPSRLVYFLTFTNELAGGGTFGHSWTLGVEEKFYLVWPLLIFSMPLFRNHRLAVASSALLLTGLAAFIPPTEYLGLYTALIVGSLVAILMHDRRTFRATAYLAAPLASLIALAAAITALIASSDSKVQVLFPLAAALVFPAIVLESTWLSSILKWPLLRRLGAISYAVYLFHPLCIEIVDRIWVPGQENLFVQILRLTAILALSACVAETMHRLVEKPMIRLGRQLAIRDKSPSTLTKSRQI